jgi:hypothetical protein
VVAVYKHFVADLEQRRDKQALEMQNEVEYFALITYDFPEKFSEAPASG